MECIRQTCVLSVAEHEAGDTDLPESSQPLTHISIFHCLKSLGNTTPVQLPTIPVIELNQVIQGLDHAPSSFWNNVSCNPPSAPSTNAKLCTYSNWFQLDQVSPTNPYFLLPVSGNQMQRFLRFRLSSHTLPIEAGRLSKTHIP